MELVVPLAIAAIVAVLVVVLSIVVVPADRAFVVERLGRYHKTLGQGLHLLLPLIDRVHVRLALGEVDLPVTAVRAITLDNLVVSLDAIVRVAVTDAKKATYEVADYRDACVQATMTALRERAATRPLEELRVSRGSLGREVTDAVGRTAAAWGLRVTSCEITGMEAARAAERPL